MADWDWDLVGKLNAEPPTRPCAPPTARSVSIGYTPLITAAMAKVALVQVSAWVVLRVGHCEPG